MPLTELVVKNMSEADKATFTKGCIDSGMRETHCEQCGCYLLTRNSLDLCPPCRQEQGILEPDLRELLRHCPECKAVGEPTDNRHKPWCSHTDTKIIACPQCGKEGESNREDTTLTCPFCGYTWN